MLESGALTEAIEALDAILRRHPDDPAACHLLGLAHYRTGAFGEAVAAFGKAKAQAGDTPAPELLFWLGMALVKSGAPVEARTELERGAMAGHLEARYQLALQYAREGRRQRDRRQRAIEQLEAILSSAATDEDACTLVAGLDRVCFTLGGLYLEADGDTESLERGIAAYRRGLAINPLSAVGHNSLGLLLEKTGRHLAALGEFKLAIQLDPDHRAAYRNLARLLCEQVGGDHIGVTMDVGNAYAVGETPAAFARRVGPWLKHVHLKDYTVHPTASGFRLKRCALGGVVDWPSMLAWFDAECPEVQGCIELGATSARHIRLFEPSWWQTYPERPFVPDAVDALGDLHRAAQAPEDWQTPHEAGADAATCADYELEQLRASVTYLRGIGAL